MTTRLGAWLLPLGLVACGNDIGITKQAQCDGVLQGQEETVDSPFDADGDGAFDGTNPDCVSTYAPVDLDCDDSNPDIRPGVAEVGCNGVDDDCDADTPDGDDVDADGFTSCDDCADSVAEVNPGAVELTCNGVDDDCSADTPDGDDLDGDGATACDDCNDSNPDIGPGSTETVCNEIDDDCNPETLDGDDLDGDGWSQCSDCDDSDPGAFPGGTEVCDNGVDDDCNGDIDDGCISDYSDTWDLDTSISYTCALGNVTIDFDQVLIDDLSPDITIDALGSGIQPGQMAGTFTTSTDFSGVNVQRGTCTETYVFEGSFTSMTSFTATFSARYTGGFNCLDCTNQTWSVTGTR
jgi:hypothetical protein